SIGQRSAPDLESAELSDSVLDVIKGVKEDVKLPMPTARPRFLVPRPVHLTAEAIEQPRPRGSALLAIVSRMGVEPVLESIDRGDPGQDQHDSFQELAMRPG